MLSVYGTVYPVLEDQLPVRGIPALVRGCLLERFFHGAP